MSSRIFQNVIIQLKDAVDRTIGVVDEQGFVVACSELAMIGSRLDDFHLYEFDGTEHPISTGTRTYCAPLRPARSSITRRSPRAATLSRTICSISAVAFNEAKNNYEEKHNKAAFIKNIILDNILPGDVYVRAKELHSLPMSRVLYCWCARRKIPTLPRWSLYSASSRINRRTSC